MGVKDLTKILKNYPSGWVSISKSNKKILASSKSLKGLILKLNRLNNPKGYIMKATRDYNTYVGQN